MAGPSRRRLLISIAMLAIGAALLVWAAPVGGARHTAPGSWTFRITQAGDFPPLDPALLPAGQPGWGELEYATCAKLYNYPDRGGKTGSLRPEIAAGPPKVSQGGRKYIFAVRRGFRFHTGARVTAYTFAYAINRNLNPRLASPAVTYLQDVVGGKDVTAGRASKASG